MLSKRISQRRKSLDLSQEDLASKIGTSQRQVSFYETGKNEPTANVLNALADALDTTTDWLLGRTEIVERPMRGQGDLTEDEIEVIGILRRKDSTKRRIIYNVIRDLAEV